MNSNHNEGARKSLSILFQCLFFPHFGWNILCIKKAEFWALLKRTSVIGWDNLLWQTIQQNKWEESAIKNLHIACLSCDKDDLHQAVKISWLFLLLKVSFVQCLALSILYNLALSLNISEGWNACIHSKRSGSTYDQTTCISFQLWS